MDMPATDWIAKSRQAQLRVRNLVDGKSCEGSGSPLQKYSPRNGEPLYTFPAGSKADVDAAVSSARTAFSNGSWSSQPVTFRKEALLRLADLIDRNTEQLALLECLDVGKPISDVLSGDIPTACSILRYCAEAADKVHGKVYGVDASSLSYQLHRPIGVVGGIVGWNFPLVLAAGKIGPALVAGNCLVLKPSELTPLSTSFVAQLAIEAGIPPGVLNVVNGDSTVGAAFAYHTGIDIVSFTGSSQTGKKLLIASGESNMKRMILECGGKAPSIVFDDAPDLDAVADAVVARAFWNQGQVCTASSRLLVQKNIKERLLEKVVARTSALRLGDPLLPETTSGAVVSREHMQKVQRYIDVGRQEGAHLAYRSDSTSPHREGFYVPPVIFDEVVTEHRIAQEEIFGPLLAVMSFEDEEDAVRIANSTIYGLSATLWTKDLGRAHRVTQGVRAGWIVINATAQARGGPAEGVVSVGGHRESGMGTEGGLEGIEAYTDKTAVQMFV